ncbi:hypothetical protein OUZ56_004596 [Daphnia magna]|uniref:Uncharacterized protein n=1 Tax=Daphnia magna TaxID=35525 RepID=A0ABQ9YQ93_9CRUS|nr:hypothetical protein OUZ56_004596 [Daphnia magna]
MVSAATAAPIEEEEEEEEEKKRKRQFSWEYHAPTSFETQRPGPHHRLDKLKRSHSSPGQENVRECGREAMVIWMMDTPVLLVLGRLNYRRFAT